MAETTKAPNTNGASPPPDKARVFQQRSSLVYNCLTQGNLNQLPRMVWNKLPDWLMQGRLGGSTSLERSATRDLDAECGYLVNPTKEQYKEAYDRISIAHRVVNIWPDECWAAHPAVYEKADPKALTPFEQTFEDLNNRVLVWHFLHRVDRLSRIGHYGLLLYGLSGGGKLSDPALTMNNDGTVRANTTKRNLVYLRAFPEVNCRILETEEDEGHPRFGQPTLYEVDVSDGAAVEQGSSGPAFRKLQVHWTRVQHVADNREASEAFGVPGLRPVLNDVLDLKKVSGSAAEMFYKGGFPGYQFVTSPDLTGEAVVDSEEVREEAEAYADGLQRYLTAVGGEWKSLAPQVADPSKNVNQKLELIAATIGVPLRILTGSESGHLASTQDAGTWKERLRGRQLNYLEPLLVRPFFDRLIQLGCLPKPTKYAIRWRDLRTLGDKDRADVFLKQVQGLMQYVGGEVWRVVPLRTLMTLMMGMDDDAADSIIKTLGGDEAVKAMFEKMLQDQVDQQLLIKKAEGTAALPGASGAKGKQTAKSASATKRPAAPQGGGRTRNAGSSGGRPPGRVEGQS